MIDMAAVGGRVSRNEGIPDIDRSPGRNGHRAVSDTACRQVSHCPGEFRRLVRRNHKLSFQTPTPVTAAGNLSIPDMKVYRGISQAMTLDRHGDA